MPEALGETAKDEELEHRRAVLAVGEPPYRRADMRHYRRCEIPDLKGARMQVERHALGKERACVLTRDAEHRVAIALIDDGGVITNRVPEESCKAIAAILRNGEPGLWPLMARRGTRGRSMPKPSLTRMASAAACPLRTRTVAMPSPSRADTVTPLPVTIAERLAKGG